MKSELRTIFALLNSNRLDLIHFLNGTPDDTLGHQAAIFNKGATHDQLAADKMIFNNLKDCGPLAVSGRLSLGTFLRVRFGHGDGHAVNGNGEATGKRHIE